VLDSSLLDQREAHLKFGFEIRKMQNNSVNPGNGPSTVFTQGATAMPNAASLSVSGNSYASFLLGNAYQVGIVRQRHHHRTRWANTDLRPG